MKLCHGACTQAHVPRTEGLPAGLSMKGQRTGSIRYLPTCGPAKERFSFAQLNTCQARPTATVTNVSLPRRCTQNGTSSEMYPSALKGLNSGSAIWDSSRAAREDYLRSQVPEPKAKRNA